MWTRQPLVLSILILIWDNMFLKHLWRKSKEAIKYVYSISHILKPCNKYSVKESYTPHKYATRLVTFGITNISTLTYADKIMLLRKKVIYLTVPNHQWDIPVFFREAVQLQVEITMTTLKISNIALYPTKEISIYI